MERFKQPIASRHKFIWRLIRSVCAGLLFITFALLIGMIGYHLTENMSWVDAFANASMILSGMGPFGPMQTTAGKIFAGIYALFSGLVFILGMGIIFAPVVHRLFHQWHIDEN